MAVVPTFVGNLRFFRAIGQGKGLRQGQGIHIRPEADGRLSILHSRFVQCIEPVPLGHDFQFRMQPDEIHQASFCFCFLPRQFRVGMEGVAQSNDLCPVQLRYRFLIHVFSFLRGSCSALLSHFLMVLQNQQKKNKK